MRQVFLWFYCLPIVDTVILVLLATLVFLCLRKWYSHTVFWKLGIPFLFLCWIAVVLFATLVQRVEGGNHAEPILIPFQSYYDILNGGSKELYRSNFMNAILFYPAGLLGYEILPRGWKNSRTAVLVTCIFLLMSISIENGQYRFGLGLAEADDVIHNSLGALLGVLICRISTVPENHK